MSRHKGMAPPPPPADKRARIMTPAEAREPETVSLLMMFDDLCRNEKVREGKVEVQTLCTLETFHFVNCVTLIDTERGHGGGAVSPVRVKSGSLQEKMGGRGDRNPEAGNRTTKIRTGELL